MLFLIQLFTLINNTSTNRISFSGSGQCIQGIFTSDGFIAYGSSYVGLSSLSFSTGTVICYRDSASSSQGVSGIVPNNSYGFSTIGSHSVIYPVRNYWYTYYSKLVSDFEYSSSDLESAYVDGYDNGLETGYWIGWDEGYETGYKSGYDYGLADGYETGYGAGAVDGYVDGFDAGYDTGFDDGYSTGYDSGYDNGYDTGYSDGLDDAPPETVTIVIYEEPVEIDVPGIIGSISSIPDSILSGSFDFEFAGINIYGLLKLLIIVFIVSAVIFFIIKRSA